MENKRAWEATASGLFSRLFVTHNPDTMAYRLLGIKQTESANVGLNTPGMAFFAGLALRRCR